MLASRAQIKGLSQEVKYCFCAKKAGIDTTFNIGFDCFFYS